VKADVKKMGTRYEKCFTGEMFAEWIQAQGLASNKQEASEIGDMLIKVPSRDRKERIACHLLIEVPNSPTRW